MYSATVPVARKAGEQLREEFGVETLHTTTDVVDAVGFDFETGNFAWGRVSSHAQTSKYLTCEGFGKLL